jgi:hypothetical protein
MSTQTEAFGWTPLPSHYTPTNLDVIIGPGREPRIHKGNVRLRETMSNNYIHRYSSVDNKFEKSLIISEIVATIREDSPTRSGFVKKVDGQWYAVDDFAARETVSQGLRNLLHNQYRSSAAAKKRKRGLVCAQIQDDVEQMMQAKCSFLSQQIKMLSSELSKYGRNASEQDLEALFTKTNVAILESFKHNNKATGPIFNPSLCLV